MPYKVMYVEYALLAARLLPHSQREQVGNRANLVEKVAIRSE